MLFVSLLLTDGYCNKMYFKQFVMEYEWNICEIPGGDVMYAQIVTQQYYNKETFPLILV